MSWQDELKSRLKRGKDKGKFKMVDGANTFRVLPNKNQTATGNGAYADESPVQELFSHRDVGPNKRMATCGKNDEGEGECWLCDDIIDKLLKSGSRAKIALAQKMARNGKWVSQVTVLDSDTGKWSAPQIWYMPSSTGDKSWSTKFVEKGLRIKGWYDPVRGRNVTVNKTGEGLNTNYDAPEPDDTPSAVSPAILAKLQPFSAVLPEYSKSAQVATWRGDAPEDEEEEAPDASMFNVDDSGNDSNDTPTPAGDDDDGGYGADTADVENTADAEGATDEDEFGGDELPADDEGGEVTGFDDLDADSPSDEDAGFEEFEPEPEPARPAARKAAAPPARPAPQARPVAKPAAKPQPPARKAAPVAPARKPTGRR